MKSQERSVGPTRVCRRYISAECIALFDSTGDCVFIESTATSVKTMFNLRPLLAAVLVAIAAGQDLPPPCDSSTAEDGEIEVRISVG
uniref:(California timema) hypothetical protein n=1 Tax=Timema californicum TaxID=61474 RepID=A0A7R9IZ80_TIMCA|nr:unnamed protein product [Timema californicum]